MNSYNTNGDSTRRVQTYMGGYIEIQPDSWDGSVPSTDDASNCWGFPMSISPDGQEAMKRELLGGNGKGIMYIRFPLGFAYRGYRNMDKATGLAKNIGERWKGQNAALKNWFSDIASAGGGLAPEYWCPPVYWLTSGAYNGADNQLRAGGNYSQSTPLASIRLSDAEQYNAQIDAFTDAVVDDLEYLHTNIAPVRMFGLQNEPIYGTQTYGACKWDSQTYNDVLEVLYPKIQASSILSTYNNEKNEILLHAASSDEASPFAEIGSTFIKNHEDMIWGYSHHSMRKVSGESGSDYGAKWYLSDEFAAIKSGKDNVFINEYEYFSPEYGTDEFRCANNMLRMIYEIVYGGARVLHPVIHLCKPTGQTLPSTNTTGYCLYAVNIDDGTYTENTWAYNSWKMFNDNLPIGAVYESGGYVNSYSVGYAIFKHKENTYIFMANATEKEANITLEVNNTKKLSGKKYSITEIGADVGTVSGPQIAYSIPAYSGLVFMGSDPIKIL